MEVQLGPLENSNNSAMRSVRAIRVQTSADFIVQRKGLNDNILFLATPEIRFR
jgi:hypothetical protein